MKALRVLHTGYGFVVFGLLFAILLPFLFIPIIFPGQHKLVGVLNRWWARLMFIFILIPFRVEYRNKPDPKKRYIFCPNHFSYLDIPAMGLNRLNAVFVGKNEISKVPVFGYMYRKLHITVNRSSMKSRSESLKQSMAAIDEGKNLVIFPEGGIVTHKDPVMGKFKDGAFRIAIEKQIAIVPVTIPFNWIILPPDQFLLRWHPLTVVFHEPIETIGLTLNDVDELKKKVFHIINHELDRQLHHENRSLVTG